MSMIIWLGLVIYLTMYFQRNMTKNQEKIISATTYFEEIVVDGKKKKIQKTKCPTCGNKEMDYQLVNSSATTIKHGNGKISTTSISSSKHAICNKCGNSFQVIRRTTPITNGIFAFFLSGIICSIGLMVFSVLLMLFGI